jgi:hypothetical protein
MKNSIIKSDYQTLIYTLRGYKVMLDFDLAILYGVETKRLKEQVRRNITRFPEDFMFVLNKDEIDNLRSQFATSSWGGARYAPMAFTEQGVAMLSSVLNSETAIQVNIEIMRAFADYRALIIRNKDFGKELQLLDEKINQIFKFLLEKIDALRGQQLDESRNKIGYKQKE